MILGVLTGHSLVCPMGQFYGKRLALSAGNYSVIVPALNPNDNNSVVNVVFQVNTHTHMYIHVYTCTMCSFISTCIPPSLC